MKKKNVYLISGKAQHGKDTFVDLFCELMPEENNIKLPLAKQLKDIATLAGWNGKKDDTGRTYLQVLGDLIKDTWGQDFFARCIVEEIEKEPYFSADNIFVPDVRFESEFYFLQDALSKAGYEVHTIRINREGWTGGLTEEQLNHRSETNLDYAVKTGKFEYIIENNNNLNSYREKVFKYITTH